MISFNASLIIITGAAVLLSIILGEDKSALCVMQ